MLDRRLLLAGLGAVPLAACATPPARERPSLTVVTFNIWHNLGQWPARLPMLVEALRSADADVIALQEVLEDEASALPNQARTLAAALGGYQVHFTSTDPEGAPRRYGNALLSRLPVLDRDSRRLEPVDDHRTALRLRVDLGGRPVDVVNTHLAWRPDQAETRARQVQDLMSWLPFGGPPLVLLGDFNATQEDAGLAALTGPRFFSALPPGAAPTTLNPAEGHAPRVIDHIFAEAAHFIAVSAGLIGQTATGGIYPSDHFGVAARLKLR
jgi:endonuclease/exonuclease/phosphatase family metal-dependent hydrolase